MKNSSNNNTLDQNIRMSNAVVDAFTNDSADVQEEGYAILIYIADSFDSRIPLSKQIEGSVDKLGYKIHPDTYLSGVNTLIDRMGRAFHFRLKQCDDIQLYNYEGDKPILELGCK